MNPITELGASVPEVSTARANAASLPSPHVQEVIRSAEQELAELLHQRSEVTRRILAIKKMLSGLAELFGRTLLDDESFGVLGSGVGKRREGLTQACRLILMESTVPLRAQQGCERLRQKFPEVAQRHQHLRASVTTVFHRLACYSEARCFLDEEGRRVWEWAGERNFGQSEAAEEKARIPSIAMSENLIVD
jgi:hypothetical protein